MQRGITTTLDNDSSDQRSIDELPSSMPRHLLQLEEELDFRLLVRLKDGRVYIGVLRSFDQYGNLLLDSVYQRLIAYSPSWQRVCYADMYLGSFIIRGDNIMLFGRMKDDEQEGYLQSSVCQSFPVPVATPSLESCRMIERPIEEVSKLILEAGQQNDSRRSPTSTDSNSMPGTVRNFMWSNLGSINEEFMA